MNIIFCLHDEKDPKQLENKLLWLRNHYNMVSSNEIKSFYYEGKKLKNACHITIDDGWLSTYQIIFPLLKKYDIPASIFVSPFMCTRNENYWFMELDDILENTIKNILIKRNYFTSDILSYPISSILKLMMIDDVYSIIEEARRICKLPKNICNVINLRELIEMDRSGIIEIGAHTMKHPILLNERADRSNWEISQSVEELSSILNRKVTSFAYPNGLPDVDFNVREINILKLNGIELAYTLRFDAMSQKDNPLLIPRCSAIHRLKLGYIGLKLPLLCDPIKQRKRIKKYYIACP